MTNDERERLIGQYCDGYEAVVRSLESFPKERLTAHPIPGKWSAAEIVHHLADSEMTSAIRLRRLVAEKLPVIPGYDQDRYATDLSYNERDIEPALIAFRGARATTAQILRRMSEDDWSREGWHSDSGRYSAETWLCIYASHAHAHASQLDALREAFEARNDTAHA